MPQRHGRDFHFDLKIWINDYLETLEQEEDQAQMEKVCRKLLDPFCVERGSSGGSEISSGVIDAVPGLKKKRPVISAGNGTCRMKMILQLQRR